MDRVRALVDRLLLDARVIQGQGIDVIASQIPRQAVPDEAVNHAAVDQAAVDRAAVDAAVADEVVTRALLAAQVTTDPGAAVVLFTRLHAAATTADGPDDIVDVMERAVLARQL